LQNNISENINFKFFLSKYFLKMQQNTNEVKPENSFDAIRLRDQAGQQISVSRRIESFQGRQVQDNSAWEKQTRQLEVDLGLLTGDGLVSRRISLFEDKKVDIRTDIALENINSVSKVKNILSYSDKDKLSTIRKNINRLKDKIKIDDFITLVGDLKFTDESKKIEAIKIFFENENSNFFGNYNREKAKNILGDDIEKNINDIVALKDLNSLDEFTKKLVTLRSENNPFIEQCSQTNPNLIYSFIEEKYVGKDVYESLESFKLPIKKIATYYNDFYFQTEAERELNAIMLGVQASDIFDKLDKLEIRFHMSQQESRKVLGLKRDSDSQVTIIDAGAVGGEDEIISATNQPTSSLTSPIITSAKRPDCCEVS
jgi:hypothetical protein